MDTAAMESMAMESTDTGDTGMDTGSMAMADMGMDVMRRMRIGAARAVRQ